MILPGKKGINYYMCTGENPSNDFYSTKKVRVIIDEKLQTLIKLSYNSIYSHNSTKTFINFPTLNLFLNLKTKFLFIVT